MDADVLPLETISERSTSKTSTPNLGVANPGLHTDYTSSVSPNGQTPNLDRVVSTALKGFEATTSDHPNTEQPSPRDRSDTDSCNSPRSSKRSSKDQQSVSTIYPSDDEIAIEQDPKNSLKVNSVPIESDAMVSSIITDATVSVDHEVIEIHQFSLADIDAYLDIYFDVLSNRLRHLIGAGEELDKFRSAMKSRIISDPSAREHQNVLLGKMHDNVVAAVLLTFPIETSTISDEQLLRQPDSCFTSLHRWMAKKANYAPTHMEECYIEMIGVKKANQNRGVGAAMLECVEHFARQAGARLLTIHVNGDLHRGYFHRSGFEYDRSDNSSWWKSMVERQSVKKMVKTISPNETVVDNTEAHVNHTMIDSLD